MNPFPFIFQLPEANILWLMDPFPQWHHSSLCSCPASPAALPPLPLHVACETVRSLLPLTKSHVIILGPPHNPGEPPHLKILSLIITVLCHGGKQFPGSEALAVGLSGRLLFCLPQLSTDRLPQVCEDIGASTSGIGNTVIASCQTTAFCLNDDAIVTEHYATTKRMS